MNLVFVWFRFKFVYIVYIGFYKVRLFIKNFKGYNLFNLVLWE